MRLLLALPGAAQDLTNAGATLTVQPGTTVYVGTGGLSNQAGGTLTNGGTLRVEGPLANAATSAAPNRAGGHGLRNMRQRGEALGGTLHAAAGPVGFALVVSLPLP